jgi:hypothetical protein
VTATGWSTTLRGRRELAAVVVFCAANLVVPLIWIEMFPFSRAPMFADAPQRYCKYVIVTPDGRRLGDDPKTEFAELKPFGLQRNYWGNPLGVGVGFKPAPGVDRFGEVASQAAVTESVRRGLASHPEWDYVEVTQTVVGPREDGSVGSVSAESWGVPNRSFRRADSP